MREADNAGGAGPYVALPRARLSDGTISVRAVEPGDIEAIRQWRNAQMDVLRQTAPITPDAQARYFATHVWPGKSATEPPQILVTIERDGAPVGYGGLVHISWPNRRAELSFLLAPAFERDQAQRADLFGRFLNLMKQMAFRDLAFHRLFTETFAQRTRHIATLEAHGFRCEGCLRQHVVIDGQPVDSLIHGCLADDERQNG